jgi:hypothetical protein
LREAQSGSKGREERENRPGAEPASKFPAGVRPPGLL